MIRAFKGFRKYTIILLVLIFVAIETSSLIISSEVIGLYNIYNEINSLGNNGIIITSYSLSPFTSLINKENLLTKLNNVSGIKNIQFIILSLGNVNGKDIAFIGYKDYNNYCAYPSITVKKMMNLKINQTLIVYPAFSNLPIELIICGFEKNLSFGIEVSNNIAYQIHGNGINNNLASIAIINLVNNSYKINVMKALQMPSEETSLLEKATLIVENLNNQKLQQELNQISEVYYNKLGIPKIAFTSLAIASIIILSIGSYINGEVLVLTEKDTLELLHFYGISKVNLAVISIIINLLSFIASIPISILLYYCFSKFVIVNILGLYLIPQINEEIVISTLSIFIISSISTFINIRWSL